VAAVAIGLSAIGASQAAVYVGNFDPVFGSPFNNPELGWRGSATFDVADACITPGLVMVQGTCTAKVTQLRLEFYDNQAPAVNGIKPTTAFINFALGPVVGGPPNGGDDRDLARLFFSATGDLLGVSLALSAFGYVAPEIVTGSPFGNSPNVPEFGMAFNLGALASLNEGPYNGPLVYWKRGAGCAENQCNGTNSTTGSGIPTFTIQRVDTPGAVVTVPSASVPAPGTALLAGLALIAAAAAGRRRRAG
jgi:hypothetical protein